METFYEWIEKLLSKINIVQVIERYIPLKRRGRTYWGCCPFHHEKDPSFAVNEERQFYHCFGCKESGNAITFVAKMESIDNIDAIKLLAKEAKMELPQLPNKKEDGITREKRERLYSLMREAGRHYHENLSSERAKNAINYLENREIPHKLVQRFGLGVSLNGSEMIRHLESKGYTKKEMKEAGLVEQKGADWYDVFYERLIIPIINNFGEVVAFGGRVITPETHTPVKYRNSSTTAIFDKSKTLYAINLLKRKKQKEKINYVIITEGYMDVIALHKAGFDTAVASMGTALTLSQAKLLRNYCDLVYISFDGDGAGKTATLRGLDILASAGLTVKVVSLPDGLDPDDLIKQQGPQAYQQLLDEALPLTEFKLKVLKNQYNPSDKEGKIKYAIESAKIIKMLEDPIEQDEYLRQVQSETGYDLDVLRKQAEVSVVEQAKQELSTNYKSRPNVNPIERENTKPKENKTELFVIASIVHAKDYAQINENVSDFLSQDSYKKAYEYVLERLRVNEKPQVAMLYTLLNEDDATEIANYEFLSGDNESKFLASIKELKLRYLVQEKERLSKQYDSTKDKNFLMKVLDLDSQINALRKGDRNEW